MSSSQRRYPPPGRGGGGNNSHSHHNSNFRSQQQHQQQQQHNDNSRNQNLHHNSPPRRSYDYRTGKGNQASGSRISTSSSSSTHYPPPLRSSPPVASYGNTPRGGERRYETSPVGFYGGERGGGSLNYRNNRSRSPYSRSNPTSAGAVRNRSPLTKRYPSPLTKIYPGPDEERRYGNRRPTPGPPPRSTERGRPSAAASSADRNGRGGSSGSGRGRENRDRSRSLQGTGGRGGADNQSETTVQKLSRRERAAENKRRVSALQRLGPKLSAPARPRKGVRGENKNNAKNENNGGVSGKRDHNGRSSDNKRQRKDPKSDDHINGDGSNGSATNNSAMQITIRADEEEREVNDDDLANEEAVGGGKHSIKLECPHCHVKCVTFKEYTKHCQSDAHNKAMKQLKNQLQLTLGRMRTKQRTQQKEIERILKEKKEEEQENAGGNKDAEEGGEKEDGKDHGGAGKQKKNAPIYCRVCKLVFHQKRSDHNSSEMHKLINKFLNPSCNSCSTRFFSPMAYEKHICSLAHIKRKIRSVADEDLQKAVEDPEDDFGSDYDQEEFDMDNFMTLDEVGEVDDEQEETSKASKEQEEEKKPEKETGQEDNAAAATDKDVKTEAEEREGDKVTNKDSEESAAAAAGDDSKKVEAEEKEEVVVPKPKLEINLEPDTPYGETYVKRVEMFYCDLCHKYLPRVDPSKSEEALKTHCKSTHHQNAYVKAKQEEFEKQGSDGGGEKEKNGIIHDAAADGVDKSDVVSPAAERDEILLGTQNFDDEDQLDYEAE